MRTLKRAQAKQVLLTNLASVAAVGHRVRRLPAGPGRSRGARRVHQVQLQEDRLGRLRRQDQGKKLFSSCSIG